MKRRREKYCEDGGFLNCCVHVEYPLNGFLCLSDFLFCSFWNFFVSRSVRLKFRIEGSLSDGLSLLMCADFLSPKDIANRIKAKGLQRLRWYCQMCGKQCRDENGFKCHLTSETHRRQMELFGQNPQRIIDGYSEEFESAFLDHLKRSHPFSRVSANVVYNEYIQDKHHIHMNSTKWLTLTEFVKYLGREGKCKVEDTPKGWFITLIQRDPFEELEGQRKIKRERAEREEEDRHQRALEIQAARAKAACRDIDEEKNETQHNLQLSSLKEPLKLNLDTKISSKIELKTQNGTKAAASKEIFSEDDLGTQGMDLGHQPRKKSKVEEIMEKDLRAKAELKKERDSHVKNDQVHDKDIADIPWLRRGIIVKVVSKALREHGYYKKKGKVLQVLDTFIGEIEMLDSGDVVRIDQAELETVIPNPGGPVLVLLGPQRGCKGELVEIDEKRFRALIKIFDDRATEVARKWLEYEEFSKLSGN